MDLHLTDEQAELLIAELDRLIDGDRYPLSPPAETPQAAVEGPLSPPRMKPYRGPLTTLGNAATAPKPV